MKKVIGIDLGTHFSEVAFITESGVVEMIPNLDGELKTLSMVSLAQGKPLVGKAATPDLILHPEYVVRCSKRCMGKVTGTNKPIPLRTDPAGREYTSVDAAADIVGYLKEGAERYLGCEITEVVITNPAYFDEIARNHTKAAAQMAGFCKVVLLDEPVSAAFHYGLEKAQEETLGVVDYGGGTLDVTALKINHGSCQTIVTVGDDELGGTNYDEGMLEFMRQKAQADGIEISAEKDLATFNQNLDRAREAKEMLARREEVLLIAEAQGKRKAIPFTRQMLRNVGKPFDDRLLNCCRRMKEQLQEKGEKLDRLLLVGGSSRLFHVSQMVKEVFSLEPARDTDPDFVVAKGAAIWATICFGQQDQAIVIGGHQYLPSQIKIQTVAAHAICIAARRSKDRRDEKEYNYEIVPANTPLPHGFEKHFAPVDPGQSSVVIKIVQGIPDELSENSTLLREITVPIKPSEKDENRILLQGRYTEEGLLETTVVDELLGQPVSDSFTYSAGLSEDEIQEKTKRLHEVTGGDR